ncbi:hypothetical protein [uncultured Thalassolituus sp.]|uniref:hypothetical protein n=1 Tax=uncultured Thalassolituus sp. TaxID=285273 RepID=UPI002637A3C6|nr:hypothetical protein [uncultured Thalassolituus sp.]
MQRHYSTKTALLAAILAATGCSSNSDSRDDDSGSSTTGTEFSGKVADGYLAGARVCLDLNSNNACDDGEPSTVSASGGAFTLEGVTQEQLESSPIVVEIIVGETVDEDEPGVAISKTYTLSAPAGSAFVSPLTTMVQNEIKEKGMSPDEAKASIKARLGTDVDPSADYVAGASDEANADEYARLHKVAQVTRAVMQQNRELVNEVVGETGVTEDDLMALIINQVLDALDDIKNAVDGAGDGFDADDLAGSDELAGTRLDPSEVENDIQQRRDNREAVAANLGALITGGDGLYFFESDEYSDVAEFFYGHVSVDSESGNIGVDNYMWENGLGGGSWVLDDSESTEQDCYLTGSNWVCVSEDAETITVDGNRIRILRSDLAVTEEFISGVEANLNGRSVSAYLRDSAYPLALTPGAVFGEGAKGYKLTFTRTNEQYRLWKENAETYCGESAFSTTEPWTNTDAWCNNVFMSWDQGSESHGMAATSLAQLVTSSAASEPASVNDIIGFDVYGHDSRFRAELVSGGIVSYWKEDYNNDLGTTVVERASVSTWSYREIGGVTVIRAEIPQDLRGQGDIDRDDAAFLLAVVDGYVRGGEVLMAGAANDDQWVFNDAAATAIKNAFDESLQYPLGLCESADNEEATLTDFTTAMSNCGTEETMGALDLIDKKLKIEDGVFSFSSGGAGEYTGRVNDSYGTLSFSWSNPAESNALVINAQTTDDAGAALFLRLTVGLVQGNARALSLVTFSQEESSSAALDAEGASGELRAEHWEFR